MRLSPRRSAFLLLALAGAMLLGGCSTYERDWNARIDLAATADAPADRLAPRLEGLWHGTWTSTKSGHSGTLRCIITPHTPEDDTAATAAATADAAPDEAAEEAAPTDDVEETNTYLARFLATYWGTFRFEYDLLMHVRREGQTVHFSSEADLGWLAGGTYEYFGTVEDGEFRSTYTSKGDYGTFEMRRVD